MSCSNANDILVNIEDSLNLIDSHACNDISYPKGIIDKDILLSILKGSAQLIPLNLR